MSDALGHIAMFAFGFAAGALYTAWWLWPDRLTLPTDQPPPQGEQEGK